MAHHFGHLTAASFLVNYIFCSFIASASATNWRHPADAFQADSSLADAVDGFPEDMFFSARDLYRLRTVLPMLPRRSPDLEALMHLALERPDGFRLDLEEALARARDEFLDRLAQDPEARDEFFSSSRESPPMTSYNSDVDEKVDVEDIPEVEERNQTQGWAGCLRDYDMVMLPETLDYERTLVLKFNNEKSPLVPAVPVPDVPQANPVAIQIVDSIARRPPGLAMGGLHWVGAVDLCVTTGLRYEWNYTEVRTFRGKYARITLPVVLENSTAFWPFEMGVCAPDTCTDEDIIKYVSVENQAMIPYLVGTGQVRNVTGVFTGYKTDFANDPAAKGCIALLIIAVVLCVVASCYDGWGRDLMIRDKIQDRISGRKGETLTLSDIKEAEDYLYGKPSFGDRVETAWAGFSFYSNLRHMYTINIPDDHIKVLDGIKAICYLWVVRSLIYVYGPVYFETWTTANLLHAVTQYLDEWQTTAWISVPYANSAFFYVSGFLCVHTFVRQYKRNNERMTVWFICRYFLHRFWWFVPTILLVLVIYSWYYMYLGSGPLSSPVVTDAENCKETWWLIGLLFNNLFRLDKQCWGWSWIFCCLWQLHIISVFIVVPLVLIPAVGYLLTACMYIAHIVILAVWEQKSYDGEDGITWYYDIMQTPWCNAGPWIIGMVFAMILKNVDRRKQWHWAPILLLWLLATAGILIPIFVPWDKMKDGGVPWTRAGEIAFGTLCPQIFALSLGWVTFACWKGYGGAIGALFHWKFFTWMSKNMMLFTIFMAPPIQLYFMGQLKPFYLNETNMGKAFNASLINIFLYANAIGLVFTYPYTRGMIAAARARTRLEAFLWAKHPAILGQFTGDRATDRARLDRLLAREDKDRAGRSPGVSDKVVGGVKLPGLAEIATVYRPEKDGYRPPSYDSDVTSL